MYIDGERLKRIRSLVREKTGMDCPRLEVEYIEHSFSAVTVFYWCEGKEAGDRGLTNIRLDDEEAERIGVSRTVRRPPQEMNQ